MNESNNPERPQKRGWCSGSIVCKAQIIGASISALATIGIVIYCLLVRPRLFDFSSLLAMLILEKPFALIRKVFGLSLTLDNGSGGFAIIPICLIVAVNATAGFLLGSLVGLLVSKMKTKPRML